MRFVRERGASRSQDVVNECRGSITGAVALIREHLEDEASRFAAGDFDDPAAIHGEDMPGLTTLRDGASEIDIQLEELDDGARLVYTTGDPGLIEALHQWAEAQVSDHGDHAEHGN